MSQILPNGTLIGRYRTVAPIGQGGMATVYKVTDTILERDVALKLIRTEQFPPIILETVLKRFEREAKALARLNHPNIVKILDYGDYQNAPYLVMDFLPGQSFKQIRKPVPYKNAIYLIRPIADALSYAHEQGIFHRDVKPGNIMLTRKGTPVLTDFGIAKLLDTNEGNTLTASGVGIGTPEYMAPEQGLGHEIDGRADQYALAIVLYELITDHKPFQADTPMEVVLKQHNDPLPPIREFAPDVPSAVETVIRRALAKSPDQRFPDMTSFARALEEALLLGSSQSSIVASPSTQTDTPVFDAQQQPDSDTVPVMPFNTEPESKVKTKPETPAKKKPQLATWLVPLALFVLVGAFFFLRRPTATPVSPVQQTQRAFIAYQTESARKATDAQHEILAQEQTATAEQAQTDELAALDATMNAFYQTETAALWTPTPTFTPTPTVPVEVATALNFLEKKQYARLSTYIRDIVDPTIQVKLRMMVDDELLDDEISLLPYQDCSGKYGFINILGDIVFNPHFDDAGNFSDGLAPVKTNGKWNFINTNGQINVIESEFFVAGNFSDGLAPVKTKDKWGYINTSGEIVINPQFNFAGSFYDGLARVAKLGKWGYINTSGEIAIEPQFDWGGSFSNGLARVKKNAQNNYINTSGIFVIELQFDHAEDFSNGLAAVRKNGKWGYINTHGDVIVVPQYNSVGAFSHGLALVKDSYFFGYIDAQGNVVIEPKFEAAEDFSEGLALVKKYNKWGYINTQGDFIIEPQFNEANSFSNGLAEVMKNGTTYFIDPTGETVFVACQK